MEKDTPSKLRQYQEALAAFIERLKEDRWILAVVQVGSLNADTVWRKDGIGLWIVEADGVTYRRRSDGEEHRIWRTLVEQDVNLWAEMIPRSRFKKMVEGSARTAFSYNFFARRTLLYSADESLTRWFEDANSVAERDQVNEVLIATGWVAHGLRHTRRLLDIKQDVNLAWQSAIETAHALAAVHVVQHGEICETQAIYRALDLAPALFAEVYTALLTNGPSREGVETALRAGTAWMADHAEANLAPVLTYLRRQRRAVPLSELADHFAYSQLYPWHLEGACEWLAESGRLEKLAADLLLTSKSRVHLEEPAYFIDAAI
ncbi:MAG: hypothetical protein R2834_24110 [Rhodothermales bacterium]